MVTEFAEFGPIRPPRSYTKGRKGGQPTVIIIHTTEGSEGKQSAEDGAAYDARRTDGTSTHFFVDQDSVVQCVATTDEAHAARSHGNDVGIQVEVCGRAGQSAAQWADAASAGAVEQAARVAAAVRRKYGPDRFPLVNLTPAQLRAGRNGFAEHYDATKAWPEDGGTHTDPGPNFPWSKLFDRIRSIEGDEDVDLDKLAQAVASKLFDDYRDPKTGLYAVMVGSERRVIEGVADALPLEAIAQAVASKLNVDYRNPKSGLYGVMTASEGRVVAAVLDGIRSGATPAELAGRLDAILTAVQLGGNG